ncbi:response regulator, partial [uncultured Hyphomonas sp.]|uniref:response regulator n=1 Tax=uncultured Hyphomonas sp. TaxID=225298 RepID=UPI00262FCE6A
MRILVVEDDSDLRRQLADVLSQSGYAVDLAADGEDGHFLGDTEPYDAVILDLGLPKMDGVSVLKKWRADGKSFPVLILTARDSWSEKVAGFDAGADDYLTKPFSPRELLARVAAVMRRIRPALAGESIEVGDITLDPVAHKVTRRGRTLQLGPTEYRLLKFFMESPGRVFSRGQLLDGVWGTESEIELRTVDVHIRRLRKAIEIEGAKDPVRTVRSAGYSL